MKPVRLATKKKIALCALVVVSVCLSVFGVVVGRSLAKDTLEGVLPASVLAVLFVVLMVKDGMYGRLLKDAWREHVKHSFVLPGHLREAMRGSPSGDEKYTSEHAAWLLIACRERSGVLVLDDDKELRELEGQGWLFLTFEDDPPYNVVAQLTDQAWAVIDDLRPKGWSPEDDTPNA